MSVHYKFKNTLDFDTITFDGLHISVGDLKRDLKKKLGKLTDFDLQITNAQTKEEYTDDNNLIPKNTSLIIARVPLVHPPKKSWDVLEKPAELRSISKPDNLGLDISKMDGTEEDKIQAMMLQSTAEYDPKSYQKLRSQPQTGEVPATYRCNRCKKTGHWIKNCPFNNHKDFMDIKKNTGIPRSFQNRDEKQEESEKSDLPKPAPDNKQEIPDDLICSICRDLFTDAVMIPCCGSSFCDDCVRTALLESDDNECPDCKEKGSSPASLIPNRFLRNSVNAFKSATGYIASQVKKVVRQPPVETEKQEEETKTVKDIKVQEQPVIEKAVEMEPKIDESVKKTEPAEETVKSKDPNEKKDDAENKEEPQTHDDIESDFEDNITVKMPPTQTENNRNLFREKPFNGRSNRPLQPPGIESSPQNLFQVQHSSNRRSPSASSKRNDWERDREIREAGPERSSYEMPPRLSHHTNAEPTSHAPYPREMQESHNRQPNPHEIFPMQRMGGMYPHMPPAHMQMNPTPPMPNHHMPSFDNAYGHIDPRANMGFPPFIRQPFPVAVRPGMPTLRRQPGEIRPGMPSNPNLASVYQGVAAKVGTGIIDDPLEVFNRIMKEKEKRKEDRRRSPDIRRSRSPDRQQRGRYRPSPADRRPIREPFPRENRGHSREKRDRNEREREKIKDREKPFMRRRRSTSFSDRSSRSRSWSMSPPRRRSRSPLHQRRSRSRPQNMNDRLRAEKNRMSRKGEGFHHAAPVQNRRSRSHGRYHPHSHIKKHTSTEEYNEKNFKRVARSPSPQFRREERLKPESNPRRGVENKLETLEPPPPGFESGHYYHWEQGEDKVYPLNMPPESYENYIPENVSDRKVYDARRDRSLSKSSSKSHNKKSRENHSNSPLAKPSHRSQREDSNTAYGRPRDEHSKLRDEHSRARDEHSKARDEHNRARNEHNRVRGEHNRNRDEISKAREDHIRGRDEHSSNTRHRDGKPEYRDKNHKEISPVVIEKALTINALKENAKKIEMMERNDAHADSSEKSKKDSSYSPASDKGRSVKSGPRSEKRLKERKKKAKKEKTERKKLKKDKKEKREKSKQTELEIENEEQYHESQQSKPLKILPKVTEEENGGYVQHQTQTATNDEVVDREQNAKNLPTYQESLPNETKFLSQENEAQLFETEKEIELLYDDVCEKIDSNFQQDKSTVAKEPSGNTPPPEFNRFDSVLDIHGYDTDFDDSHPNAKSSKGTNPIPISKWELDEPNGVGPCQSDSMLQDELEVDTKVTNEVLRKAEKAIFARAINAIRPIEAKKHSSEKVIVSSSKERSPTASSNRKREGSVNNLKDFQITVPVGSAQERSVEFKSDKSERILHSPSQSKPSIRDRLGSKVSVHKNRISPQRHSSFHSDDKTRRDNSKDRPSRLDLSHTERHFRDKSIDTSANKKLTNKDDRSGIHKRQRSRERKPTKEYERGHYKERERDKVQSFNKSESRAKVDDHLQNKRPKSEHDRRDDGPSRHNNSQSRHSRIQQYSENERDEYKNDRKQHHEGKYIDNDAFNFERSRVAAVNPFRKNIDPNDMMIADSYERENSKVDLIKDQSSSSSGSDSETESDDAKRKKKRKEKKERKRARRSSSLDSSGSVKKKHKKKRNKSSKKKKKNKK